MGEFGGAFDEPYVCVKINKDYAMLAAGALEAYLRPELWDTALYGETTLEWIRYLQAAFMGYDFGQCGSSELPNWYLNALHSNNPCGELISQLYGFWPMTECQGANDFRAYAFFASQETSIGSGEWTIGIRGFDFATGVFAGGKICELQLYQTDNTLANVWLLDWDDCLGVHNQEQFAGPSWTKLNFLAKTLCISSLAPFAGSVTIAGDAVCVAA